MPAAGCQPAARAADERGRAGDCGGGRGEQPRADAARLRGGGGVPAADAARQLRPLPRKVRLARLEVPPPRPGRGSRCHCREASTLPQCRRRTGGRAPDGRPSLASHVPRPPVASAATGALCPPRPVLPASPSAPPFPAAKDEPSADAAAAEPPSAFGRPQMCVCVPHPAPRRCTTPRRAAAKLRAPRAPLTRPASHLRALRWVLAAASAGMLASVAGARTLSCRRSGRRALREGLLNVKCLHTPTDVDGDNGQRTRPQVLFFGISDLKPTGSSLRVWSRG